MNSSGMRALAQVVRSDAAVAALVGDRVTWDDGEIDVALPCAFLRLLSTAIPAQLADAPGLSNPLVEVSAEASTVLGASELLDAVVAALEPYRNRSTVALDGGGSVVFPSVRLVDVQMAPSPRDRVYRKVAFFSVWQEG